MFGVDFHSCWSWFRDRRLVALPVSLALVPMLLLARPLDRQSPEDLSVGLAPPRQEEPSFTFSCTPQEEAQGDTIGPAQAEPERPTEFFFVRNQVILFGPEQQVSQLAQADSDQLRAAQGEGSDLRLIRDCQLDFPRTFVADDLVDPGYFPRTAAQLVLRLYEFDIPESRALQEAPNPVVEFVQTVNQERDDLQVVADPNYITGMLGQNQCGSPHDPGGSPHDPGGSPFEAYATHHESRGRADAPDAGPGPPGGASLKGDYPLASAEEFWDQWAFEHIGLGPFSEYMLGTDQTAATGEGIHVAVFDTSPFTPSVTSTETITSTEPITWQNRSGDEEIFTLKLAFPVATRLDEIQAAVPATTTNVIDHGLFVAGMVHAVAPDSDVELIRVLNDYGCGDLQTLNESLLDFFARQDEASPGPRGVVMNLSLGINKPRSVHGRIKNDQQSKRLTGLTLEELKTLAAQDLNTLPAVLSLAHSRQAVVVAASGNESSRTRALPMHLPADYPFVIGVASSNIERDRACFSNWGDVAAPGGDGRSNPGNPNACLPAHSAAPGDPDAALIGLAWHPPDSTADPPSETRPYYRHWSGTSFSAPLVSGLAALVLDDALDGTSSILADDVFEAIRCGSPPPDGVVSVPVTLSSRCLP